MKTSQEWWNEVKASEPKLIEWLTDQYRGEATAVSRLQVLLDKFVDLPKNARHTVERIMKDEAKHSEWIKQLLVARNITIPEVNHEAERYWPETIKFIETSNQAMAVAGHAEAMRLERIRVIASDDSAPTDVRAAFQAILPDEEFHERAFKAFAGEEALEQMLPHHKVGMEALGLVI